MVTVLVDHFVTCELKELPSVNSNKDINLSYHNNYFIGFLVTAVFFEVKRFTQETICLATMFHYFRRNVDCANCTFCWAIVETKLQNNLLLKFCFVQNSLLPKTTITRVAANEETLRRIFSPFSGYKHSTITIFLFIQVYLIIFELFIK